jgi:hypothetical protein
MNVWARWKIRKTKAALRLACCQKELRRTGRKRAVGQCKANTASGSLN